MIQLTYRFSIMVNYDTGSIGRLKGPLKVKTSALFLVRLPHKVSWFISPSISHIHLVLQDQQSF